MAIRSASGKLRVSTENVGKLEQASGYRFPVTIEEARGLMEMPGYLDMTTGENSNPAPRQMISAFFALHGDAQTHTTTASSAAEQRAAREGAPAGPIVANSRGIATDTIGE